MQKTFSKIAIELTKDYNGSTRNLNASISANEAIIKSNEKILYKIDDVIIYEDKEYLDAKNLKKYPIGEYIFWISFNCTLADIEKFNSIYFNICNK